MKELNLLTRLILLLSIEHVGPCLKFSHILQFRHQFRATHPQYHYKNTKGKIPSVSDTVRVIRGCRNRGENHVWFHKHTRPIRTSGLRRANAAMPPSVALRIDSNALLVAAAITWHRGCMRAYDRSGIEATYSPTRFPGTIGNFNREHATLLRSYIM